MKTFTITALLALFCSFPPVQAQQTGETPSNASAPDATFFV